MQDDKIYVSKFNLFINFIKADKRFLPELTKKLKKRIPGDKLDFPLLRYIFSLRTRLIMLNILRDSIHKSNKEAIDEMERIEENASGTNEKGLFLVIQYESFLNQIYNIMENLAKINCFMFDHIKNQPPMSFSVQMKRIKNGKLKFHPKYDTLIKTEMKWYEEVHQIRSNTNHYTVGMNIYGRTKDDVLSPEYLNYNISERCHNDKNNKIERNILNDTEFFHKAAIKTLNQISEIYIEIMDKEEPCLVPFIGNDIIEFRELSFSEYMSGKKGKLIQFPIQRK